VIPPLLGSTWDRAAAFVALDVPVGTPGDQQTADLLAESAAFQQAAAGWKAADGFPVITYQSAEQSVTETCSDGSLFTFGVVPGLFIAFTQAEADGAALSYCQRQIQLHQVCLSASLPVLCLNESAIVEIEATGFTLHNSQENLWELTGGELPPGLTFNGGSLAAPSVLITGLPTMAGAYTFSIKVTTPQGDFMEKAFTLDVVGVTSTVLPTVTALVPISFQLLWQGFDAPAFVAANLPPGLSMNSAGVISGTPTLTGDFTFVVDVTDSVANCQTEISLSVNAYPTYQVTPALNGVIAYFNSGAIFPAGTYQISYVNGAVHSNSPAGWYLNNDLAGSAFFMRYPGSNVPPWGDPEFPGTGTPLADQAAVEAANNGRFWQFVHTGGQIGVYNPGGVTAGSPSPTFLLTRIS
jgi:hypothetical protein